MFTVTIGEEMLEKLRAMLEDEDEETCIRLREYKVGGGLHCKIVLGLGMEEMYEDEDEKVVVEDVPFIADKDFLTKYGKAYELSFNEDRQVVLTASGV